MAEKKDSQGIRALNTLRSLLAGNSSELNREGLNQTILNDPFFVRLMSTSTTIFGVFNHETTTYEYFSPNTEGLFGYKLDQLQGLSGAEFALNTFHPDHMNTLLSQMEVVKGYYEKYSKENRLLDTRYTFSVQLKKASGEYVWTLLHTGVMEITPEGSPYRSLIQVTDITGVKTNPMVDFVFSLRNETSGVYETIHMSHHDSSKEYQLSKREMDILNCVSKGMRNHEIADQLNISKHTVITHKRNIMKKSGKGNILQLLMT